MKNTTHPPPIEYKTTAKKSKELEEASSIKKIRDDVEKLKIIERDTADHISREPENSTMKQVREVKKMLRVEVTKEKLKSDQKMKVLEEDSAKMNAEGSIGESIPEQKSKREMVGTRELLVVLGIQKDEIMSTQEVHSPNHQDHKPHEDHTLRRNYHHVHPDRRNQVHKPRYYHYDNNRTEYQRQEINGSFPGHPGDGPPSDDDDDPKKGWENSDSDEKRRRSHHQQYKDHQGSHSTRDFHKPSQDKRRWGMTGLMRAFSNKVSFTGNWDEDLDNTICILETISTMCEVTDEEKLRALPVRPDGDALSYFSSNSGDAIVMRTHCRC